MQTVNRKRFYDKIRYFETNVELVHGIVEVFINKIHDDPSKPMTTALGVTEKNFPLLSTRKNTKNSRKIIAQHLRYTTGASFIKDLYEELTLYLSDVIVSSARNGVDANRFIGEHKIEISARDLLGLNNWEAVLVEVSRRLFRVLENEQSTIKLIQQLDKKLGLNLDSKIIESAMPYLDMRHLFVHNDGKVDTVFKKAHPNFSYKLNTKQRIALPLKMILDSRAAVSALVDEIDGKIISQNLIASNELIG